MKKENLDSFLLYKEIRERLISLRLAKGLSLVQVGKYASISRNGLEKIEKGEVKPSLDTLCMLCNFYGESFNVFLYSILEKFPREECQEKDALQKEIDRKMTQLRKNEEFERVLVELEYGFLIPYLQKLKRIFKYKTKTWEALATIIKSL